MGEPKTLEPERLRLVTELKAEGLTYREIGARLGVTAGRVRQMVRMAECWAVVREHAPHTVFALSTRTQKVLIDNFGLTYESTAEEVARHLDRLRAGAIAADRPERLKNFGAKSLLEIEAWLAANGALSESSG